jgi:hypothetical protein
MLKIENKDLPCLVVGRINVALKIENLNEIFDNFQEMILLDITKDNEIYKLIINYDDECISNPRYFTNYQNKYLIECTKKGKIAKRMNEYYFLFLSFHREIKLPRLPFNLLNLIKINNNKIKEELLRLEIINDNIFSSGSIDDNEENINKLLNYWNNIIIKRHINSSYNYNGAVINYINIIHFEFMS